MNNPSGFISLQRFSWRTAFRAYFAPQSSGPQSPGPKSSGLESFGPNNSRVILGLGLLLALLFISPLRWIAASLLAPEYREHGLLLAGFLIFFLVRKSDSASGLQAFRPDAWAFALFGLGILGFLYADKFLRIKLIGCVFMGLALYAFAGFFMSRARWINCAPIIGLFWLCLPLSYHLETFAGFPLRLLSARLAHYFFAGAGGNVHSAETILVIENVFSNVDLPCSGLKSLFSILIFALAFSIIEKYKINLRWLLALFLSCLGMLIFNVGRIIVLVLICGANLPAELKESLHLPVGLAGFILACLLSCRIFSWLGQKYSEPDRGKGVFSSAAALRPVNLQALCALILVLLGAIGISQTNFGQMNFGPMSFGQTNLGQNKSAPPAAPGAGPASLPLTEKEAGLFLGNGVLSYEKSQIKTQKFQGTAFLVLARSWRAHHHPEQCLRSQGHKIKASQTLALGKNFNIRLVSLQDLEHVLVYWFQSAQGTSEDYASRVWSGIINPEQAQVMISLYLENFHSADEELHEIAELFFQKAKSMLKQGEVQ